MKLLLAILAVLFIIPTNNLRAQQKISHGVLIENIAAQQKNGFGPFFNKHNQRHSGLNKTTFANNLVYCPDTLITYSSNGNTRYMDIYNQKGLTTQRLIQYYSNGQWINYSLDSWTYFNANNNSNDVEQLWVNNQWTNHSLDSSTYDSKGQMLVHLNKYWSQGGWKDSIRSFRTYDAYENMLSNTLELWSGTQWINSPESQSYSYTYDAGGHMLTELNQILNNGQVENSTLSTYTYDANGNKLSYLLQISANGQMTNSMIHTYAYDANGKMLTDSLKGWTNETWMNGSLSTYTYDAQGNMVNVLVQSWLKSLWANSYQTTYTYDSHGNLIVGYNNNWVNSSWVQSDNQFTITFYDGSTFTLTGYKITISYSLLNITDVSSNKKNAATEYSLSQNYPNPFNPSTTISFRLPSKSFVSLKIFDLIGREVATIVSEEMSAGSYSQQWNAFNISSGIYFYRLQAGTYLETKKLILLK
jgi:hypothetical protein